MIRGNLKRVATFAMLLGAALFPVACGSDENGAANPGADDELDFALEELPEIDEEHRLLPHVVLDEDFAPEEGQTFSLQGRVKEIRHGLFSVQLVDDTKVDYNPAMREPWIYCCSPEEARENLINVRFVREGAETPVREGEYVEPSFRLVDLITVVGTFIEESDGTPIFLATGYVVDERPELGDHVQWPES